MDSTEEIVRQQIDLCLKILKDILGNNLLGVYLYGSYLLGGLQKYSDIDLFVILDRETTYEEKEQLERALLEISGIYAVSIDRKPIELIFVVKSEVNPWHFQPEFDYPKFDFQYGEWMRKDFEDGNVEPWPNHKKMPNLALIITQLLLSHKTFFGPSPDQLLEKIPYKDFISGTAAEVGFLMKEIDSDTRNTLLTLARMWSTLETDSIRPKSDAAAWAIGKLPNEYKEPMKRARAILLGEKAEYWEDLRDKVKPTTEFIIEKIDRQIVVINASDYTKKSIKIA